VENSLKRMEEKYDIKKSAQWNRRF